ncbi:MAG: type II toxin-antitoxin system RelE/ParE family toxin [Rickettsiales bacterium]|nr:type II toxin-antitoxin system RelE/ParE family toxin [Rickettsiales bacterium]
MLKICKINYVLSKQALSDIDSIWLRIAKENIKAADSLTIEFYKVFEMLALFPLSGSLKPEFTNKYYRWFPVHNYWIAYIPDSSPIRIARVINSYRNIPYFFKN